MPLAAQNFTAAGMLIPTLDFAPALGSGVDDHHLWQSYFRIFTDLTGGNDRGELGGTNYSFTANSRRKRQ